MHGEDIVQLTEINQLAENPLSRKALAGPSPAPSTINL